MKKVFVSLLLLSSFALAEEKNKNFWGVQFGLANAKSQQSNVNISVPTHKSYRSAFLLGYEKALCKTCESEYSMRYYGLIDFGTKYNNGETGPAGYHIYTYNFNFNVDLMRNFFNTSVKSRMPPKGIISPTESMETISAVSFCQRVICS